MPRLRHIVVLGAALSGLISAGCAPHRSARIDSDSGASDPISLLTYHCNSSAQIQASYPTHDVAVVRYHGQTEQLAIARSADGARYTGSGWVWWTKGSGTGASATLFEHAGDNGTGRILERCEQVAGGS